MKNLVSKQKIHRQIVSCLASAQCQSQKRHKIPFISITEAGDHFFADFLAASTLGYIFLSVFRYLDYFHMRLTILVSRRDHPCVLHRNNLKFVSSVQSTSFPFSLRAYTGIKRKR